MKKIFPWLVALTATILTSCTLYMDELEADTSITPIRVGNGYDAPVHIEGKNYNATYQFKQETVFVTEETELYIAKVEDDTIVYFRDDTPDEYLPKKGEYICCGERKSFPDGFKHQVIEREHVDGMYRCVCTAVTDMGVMFEKLKYEAWLKPEDYEISDSSRQAAIDYLTSLKSENGDSVVRSARGINWMTRAGDDTDEWLADVNNDDTQAVFTLQIFNGSLKLDGYPQSGQSGIGVSTEVKGSAELYIGLSIFESYDSEKGGKGTRRVSFIGGLVGEIAYTFSAGIKFSVPLPLPTKIGADLYFLKAQAGIMTDIFYMVGIEIAGNLQLDYGVALDWIWEKAPGRDDWERVRSAEPRKFSRTGRPGFSNTATSPHAVTVLQAGIDVSVGFEVKLLGIKAACKEVATCYLEQKVDHTQIINDTKAQNPLTPQWVKGKKCGITLNVGFSTEYTKGIGNLSLLNYKLSAPMPFFDIPFFPELKEEAFICRSFPDDGLEHDHFEIQCTFNSGLAACFSFLHKFDEGYIYIYKASDLNTPIIKRQMSKGVFGKPVMMSFNKNELQANVKYVAKPVLRLKTNVSEHGDELLIPYEYKPFEAAVADVHIAEEGTGQGVVLVRCDKGAYIFNGQTYQYRYKLRTDIYVDHVVDNKNVANWGVRFGGTTALPNFDYNDYLKANINHVSFSKDTKKFSIYCYTYSQQPLQNAGAWLYAKPYIVLTNGKLIEDKFPQKDLVYGYDPSLEGMDKSLPVWGETIESNDQEFSTKVFRIEENDGAQGAKLVRCDRGVFRFGKNQFEYRYKLRIDVTKNDIVGTSMLMDSGDLLINLREGTGSYDFNCSSGDLYLSNKQTSWHSTNKLKATIYTYVYSKSPLFGKDNILTIRCRRSFERLVNSNSKTFNQQILDTKQFTVIYNQELEGKEAPTPAWSGAAIFDVTKNLREGEHEDYVL